MKMRTRNATIVLTASAPQASYKTKNPTFGEEFFAEETFTPSEEEFYVPPRPFQPPTFGEETFAEETFHN